MQFASKIKSTYQKFAAMTKKNNTRASASGAACAGSGVSDRGGRTDAIRADEKLFDSMNYIIANLLLNLTRFVLLYS